MSQKSFTISNCVTEFDPEKVEPTKAGYQFWFANKDFLDGRTLKLSTVNPGMKAHEPHTHDEDEFFFVIEGRAEFFLDGTTREADAYTLFYCPPNIPHGICNCGNTVLKYLVIKNYKE
jgi:mannose-6-phosphate isomerase-like protein (cupin superfamily)